jgi:hypothetical protein
MPTPEQQKQFEKLEARYLQLRVMRAMILDDAAKIDPDVEPLGDSILADIRMIGDELLATRAAMETILVGKTR